jgi:hypothetical protein
VVAVSLGLSFDGSGGGSVVHDFSRFAPCSFEGDFIKEG